MLISLIVASSQNRVIGVDGQLPWSLPKDLQRFKQLTMGHCLLMGRKTYQSIGRPLPGRETIIVSRDPDYRVAGCSVVSSLRQGLEVADCAELFICGGGEIYRQALPLVEKIYLTELLCDLAGDTFLPPLPLDQFQTLHHEEYRDAGEPCRFSILQRLHC